MNPSDIVREGYDRVSRVYRDDVGAAEIDTYTALLKEITALVAEGSPVLDLGGGCGIPATQMLARRFHVTGVDISSVQIERARKLVPGASFIEADMATLDFPAASFDAIVSFYAIIHVPLERQPQLFDNIARWLKPGGYVLAIVGAEAWTGTEENWLGTGATMYWSHADEATYVTWLQYLRFVMLRRAFVPEGDGGHVFLLAQKAE